MCNVTTYIHFHGLVSNWQAISQYYLLLKGFAKLTANLIAHAKGVFLRATTPNLLLQKIFTGSYPAGVAISTARRGQYLFRVFVFRSCLSKRAAAVPGGKRNALSFDLKIGLGRVRFSQDGLPVCLRQTVCVCGVCCHAFRRS